MYFRVLTIVSVLASGASGAVPAIDILSPSGAAPGAGPVTLKIHGTNFAAYAMVGFSGQALQPSSVTLNEITVTVPASSLTRPGTALVTVINPPLGTKVEASTPADFSIATPALSASFPNPSSTFSSRTAVAGDFNHDGNIDLVLSGANTILFAAGDGAGHFVASTVATGVLSNPELLSIGDFNGDGIPDVLASSGVLLGDGTGHFTFVSSPLLSAEDGTLYAADFNGDGILDIAEISYSGNITILFGDGAGNFAPGSTLSLPSVSFPSTFHWGDFNNDGKLDLVVIGPSPADNTKAQANTFLGDGLGNFSQGPSLSGFGFGAEWIPGDFNNDGNLDLTVGGETLLGDGNGGFTLIASFGTPTAYGGVSADFNGDGIADLALGGANNVSAIFLGIGNGTFTQSPGSLPGFDGALVSSADFNNDGLPDLLMYVALLRSTEVAVSLQNPRSSSAPQYSITDLCAPRNCSLTVLGNSGAAAGPDIVVYPGIGIVDISVQIGEHFNPTAINLNGAISGQEGIGAAVWAPHSSELFNLDSVFGWTSGVATFINDNNRIAGYSPTGPPISNLVPGESLTVVSAITDTGLVLGYDSQGPLAWASGMAVTRLPANTVLNTSTFNSAGQVLVSAPALGQLFNPGSGITTQAAVPGFQVQSFNTLGQFVGYDSQFGSTTSRQIALYSTITGPVALQSLVPAGSGWTLNQVIAINDYSQILVTATQPGRGTTSLLLTPQVSTGSVRPAVAPASVERGCESFTINAARACAPANERR